MLDRLISGAGAVTDAADRSVRSLGVGSSRSDAAPRPGSLAVAAILAILSLLSTLAGLEATDPSTPVPLDAAQVAAARNLPDRTYATIRGSLSPFYVETFEDEDGDGVEDPGENTVAWYYVLVDPIARTGVTVRSTRPPASLLTYHGSGLLRTDPAYPREAYEPYEEAVTAAGLQVEADVVLDATAGMAGPTTTIDLAGPLPPRGSPVEISGSWLGSYLGICGRDRAGDRRCDPGDEDRYEIVVFDATTRHAIRVFVRDVPEFGGEATLTGSLRRAERDVDAARAAYGLDVGDVGLEVSDRYLLVEARGPGSAPLAFTLAVVLFAIAGVIVIGLASGYLVYRRSEGPLPGPASTLAEGEAIPVRITGLVRTPTGIELVREAPGDLMRVLPEPPEPPESSESSEAPGPPETSTPVASSLAVQRSGFQHGVALGLGEVTRLSLGRVMTLRAPRPAIRVTAGTGPVLLSFDSAADRDRAAAELIDEGRLGPDGTPRPTD